MFDFELRINAEDYGARVRGFSWYPLLWLIWFYSNFQNKKGSNNSVQTDFAAGKLHDHDLHKTHLMASNSIWRKRLWSLLLKDNWCWFFIHKSSNEQVIKDKSNKNKQRASWVKMKGREKLKKRLKEEVMNRNNQRMLTEEWWCREESVFVSIKLINI